MATNPSTLAENVGRITVPDANYLYGSAKDDTTGTTGDGTPFKSALLNDIYGFQQAMLKAAAVVPTGSADTAIASQYLDSLDILFARRDAGASDINATWEWQDDVQQAFGDDADAQLRYHPATSSFDLQLVASRNFRLTSGATLKLEYEHTNDRFEIKNGADLRIFDDLGVQFGTGGDAVLDYDLTADSLDVSLDSTADYRLRDNGATKYHYDNSANQHTYTGNVIINDQIRNTSDPVGVDDLARKQYVDIRISDTSLFSGSVQAPNSATLSESYLNFRQVMIKSVRGGAHSTMVIPTGIIVLGQDFTLATNGNDPDGHAIHFEFTSVTAVKVLDSDGTANPLVQVIGLLRI